MLGQEMAVQALLSFICEGKIRWLRCGWRDVIGRKNWLFSNTSRGAHASAILYSLIEIARANGIDCYAYLSHLLNQIPKENCSLDELMPWRFNKA